VTTEDDFRRRLNRVPWDWQARLVFADWLEERGDPRAEGYRAMGRRKRFARLSLCKPKHYWWWDESDEEVRCGSGPLDPDDIPTDWLRATAEQAELLRLRNVFDHGTNLDFPTRKAAEDAAALAFARLPEARRKELLEISPTVH
jgi:uncharacterized protein (TIGR02996 family)